MRKRPILRMKPRQYDGGVVRLGQCSVCFRDARVLTKHEIDGLPGCWTCADTEGCAQAEALAEAALVSSKDAVREVGDEGD